MQPNDGEIRGISYESRIPVATDISFVDYVTEQSGLRERITHKKMFGEYGIYIDGKVVAFACDNSLFVKAAAATAAMTANLPRRPPIPWQSPIPLQTNYSTIPIDCGHC